MAEWKITKSWSHDPQEGSDRSSARSYKLEREGVEVQSTVEFDDLVKGSPQAAVRAIQPFLNEVDTPPRRLLVGRDGTTYILEPEQFRAEDMRKHAERVEGRPSGDTQEQYKHPS